MAHGNKQYGTVAQYAAHRKISQKRVYDFIKNGNLYGCLRDGKRGKEIHFKNADDALEKTLDRKYNRPKKVKVTDAEKESVILESGLNKSQDLYESQRQEALYKAALKKLEYETKQRDLIPTKDVELAFANIVISARSKILSIKGTLAPLLKEFVQDPKNFGTVMESIETAVRDILTEMADTKIE